MPEKTSSPDRPTIDPMEAYFQAHPAPAKAAPSLDGLVGRWEADSASVQLLIGPDAEPSATGNVPLSFQILQEGGAYLLRWNETGKPDRKLSVDADKVLAKGEPGSRELVLIPSGEKLLGVLAVEKPFPGRMEFYASRKH